MTGAGPFGVWLSLFLLCVAAGWPTSAAAAPERVLVERFKNDPIGVVQMRLPNGLTVLLSENHERAEIFGAVVVRAGGKNDPADNTGIAHYLEHMLFKGTTELGTIDYAKERPHLEQIERLYAQYAAATTDEDRKRLQKAIDAAAQSAAKWAVPNELDHLIAEIGGTQVNAFTSNDITAYYNLFPASQLATWLDLYAHRFEQPVFRLFPSELEAVYEEKNRSMDGFMEPAYEEFMRSFYGGHPYGEQPVLGTVEHLKRPSIVAMREFYERYYVASNMALVLSGDFEAVTVAPMIAEKFGGWRSGNEAKPLTQPTPKFQGRTAVTRRLTPIRAAALAFHTPTQGHADYGALQIARRVLANGDRAGVLDRLVDDGKLLLAMLIPMDFHDQDGLVLLYAPRIVSQTMRRAESLVRGAIDSLREGKVPDDTIEAARRNLLLEIEGQWEDNEERALVMADTWARHHSWDTYVAMLDDIRSATPAAVAQAADRWMGDNYLSFRSRFGLNKPGKLTKPDYTPVVPEREAHSPYHAATHPLPEVSPRPRFVDLDTDVQGGISLGPAATLTTANNPHNDIYTLSVRFGLGHDARPELTRLANYLPKVGTKSRGADGFTSALYDIATTLDMTSTDEEFVVTLQGPEQHLHTALSLLSELMTEPADDRRRLRTIRREAWATERVYRDEPQEVAQALWAHVLYGERSGQRRRGMRAMRAFSTGSLLRAWSAVQTRHAQVQYIGRKTKGLGVTLARALPWTTKPQPAEKVVHRVRATYEDNQVFFVPKRNTVQTQLWFYVQGEPVPLAQAAARDAYEEYLAGSMGGIIFQEIREYRALAYSAYGGYDDPDLANRPGYFYGYVGCQADKTADAIDVMKTIISDLPKKPERMNALRGALSRSQETADPQFRDLPQAIAQWRWQGYATDPRRLRQREYDQLKWNDIEDFWRAYVKDRPIVMMVVADPKRIDMALLREHGPVTTVREAVLYAP